MKALGRQKERTIQCDPTPSGRSVQSTPHMKVCQGEVLPLWCQSAFAMSPVGHERATFTGDVCL